jgi:hypothetical protein
MDECRPAMLIPVIPSNPSSFRRFMPAPRFVFLDGDGD